MGKNELNLKLSDLTELEFGNVCEDTDRSSSPSMDSVVLLTTKGVWVVVVGESRKGRVVGDGGGDGDEEDDEKDEDDDSDGKANADGLTDCGETERAEKLNGLLCTSG